MAGAAGRESVARRLPWADCQTNAMHITEEVAALLQQYGPHAIAVNLPDEWVDAFSAAGTPEEATASIRRLSMAGANTVIFQPLEGDPDCLDEYIRYLVPLLRT